MRLAVFLLTVAIPTGANALQSFETKSGCFAALETALQSATWAEQAPAYYEQLLEQAPASAQEHVAAAISAISARSQADIAFAEALMLICQSYD